MDAINGKEHERVPVWYMRQAGRYMASYRSIRKKYTMGQICHDPGIASELTWDAYRFLGTDAAIIFSDIAIPLESMGYEVDYVEGRGPVPSKVEEQKKPESSQAARAIKQFKAFHSETPIIGFVGGPLTLASYIEGKGPDIKLAICKKLLWNEDGRFQGLLQGITELLKWEISEQIDAGANAIQIFDSWLGNLDPESVLNVVDNFVKPLTDIIREKGSKSIYFSTETSGMMEELMKTNADFLSLDWRTDLATVHESFPKVGLQGNLDPLLVESYPEKALSRARAIISSLKDCDKYVFNLGHGVLPGTDQEALKMITNKLKGES